MNTEKWKRFPEEKRIPYSLVIIFVFSVFILSTNFYFKLTFQSKFEDVEKRVSELEVKIDLSKEILENTTDILNYVSFVLLKDKDTKSGRVKRHVSSEEKGSARVEKTLHSLRREMFSLNDKLRILISDPDKGLLHGISGHPGPPGKPGANGMPGINGRDGFHGPVGMPGPIGRPGAMGPEGPPGKDGLNGRNGIPGFSGRKGEKGPRGRDGRIGLPGIPGTSGRDGQPGRGGLKGMKGEPGECRCEMHSNEKKATEQQTEERSKELIYTISGSSTCPTTSNIIYSGEISSIKLEQEGGKLTGSNPLCIPIYSRHRHRSKRGIFSMMGDETSTQEDAQNVNNTSNSTIIMEKILTTKTVVAATERKANSDMKIEPDITSMHSNISTTNESTPTQPTFTTKNKIISTSKMNGFVPKYASLIGTRKYVPCAVCEAFGKSSKLMIPGNTYCPKSWSVEYQGYLMNYHHGSRQSEVLCVYDQALGVSPSSDAGIREIISKYMSHVRSSCDSFQCPPHNEELLKCVVCSK